MEPERCKTESSRAGESERSQPTDVISAKLESRKDLGCKGEKTEVVERGEDVAEFGREGGEEVFKRLG